MANFAFWLSLPWVLPQALWVRRRTPRFRGPSDALRGEFGATPTRRIIGVGDSIIAGVGASTPNETLTAQVARHWHEATGLAVEWRAYGKIGARSARIKQLTESLEPDECVSLVLVSAGVNDITSLTTIDDWLGELEAIRTHLRQRYANAPLALLGIPPLDTFPALPAPLRLVLGWRAADFDRVAREFAAKHTGVFYVPIDSRPSPDDFSADGFHPSATSYSVLAKQAVSICRDSNNA